MGTQANGIYPYGYKPNWKFLRCSDEEQGGEYFGVELEMDGGDDPDVPARLQRNSRTFFFTHDGSLRMPTGYECELTTHPCSLKYHQTKFGWGTILSQLVAAGYKSHHTKTSGSPFGCAGIHVHVGKRTLDMAAQARLAILIYKCAPWVQRIARRPSGNYNTYAVAPTTHDRAINTVYNSCHTSALNFSPTHTVEFRVFRGTLNEATVLATIEFVHACTKFAQQGDTTAFLTATPKSLWFAFVDFVAAQNGEYRYLPKYINVVKAGKDVAYPGPVNENE